MTDLDERIASVLRERADGEIDMRRLTTRAVVGGRRLRRRRQALVAVGVAVIALLGGAAAVGPGLGRPFLPTGSGGVAPPLLPSVPGAAEAPAAVGTDGGVLHFGIDARKARYLRWQVAGAIESVSLDVGEGRPVVVELTNSPDALRLSSAEGVPFDVSSLAVAGAFDGSTTRLTVAGMPLWVRQWQPAPGLYARASISAGADAGLATAAEALRLTEARRCTAPVRLSAFPDGARLSSCSVDVDTFPKLLNVRLSVGGPGDEVMTVSYLYTDEAAPTYSPGNTSIGGRPAYLYPKGDRLELLGFPKSRLLADFGWPQSGFDRQDAALVLGGADVASNPTDPATWN
ncbi:hypothetical protein [Micromonospora robiginosa]|uniref:Uncharacterized protein n=1 Tax=Micromonospora robiginosa TaxID=2749844 RepID=A0A7L6B7F6_9ACTN|nr:hypothetical protein [Micromonospora ferruginea]QLQ37530.1 hypothetical protein H1D33_01055 [Micromonospora ferruginea]